MKRGRSRKSLAGSGQLSLPLDIPKNTRLHKWTQESLDEIAATRNAVRGFARPYNYAPMIGHDGKEIINPAYRKSSR